MYYGKEINCYQLIRNEYNQSLEDCHVKKLLFTFQRFSTEFTNDLT